MSDDESAKATRRASTGEERRGPGETRPGRPPRGLGLARLLTLADQTDETGRLLLEDSAPKRARREAERAGIRMKTVPCPYKESPSRFGRPMNQPAYESLRRDTAEVLAGFAWLSREYLRRGSAAAGTVPALVETSKLATMVPLVLFHRAHDPVAPHRTLPSFVASIFKASRGVFSAAVDMLERAGVRPVTAAEVAQFAEEHGHLARAETRRVCAAPPGLIAHTVEAMIDPTGRAGGSTLSHMLDFAMLWALYEEEAGFSRGFARYRTVLEAVAERAGGRRPSALFDVTFEEGGAVWTFGEFTDSFLAFANAVQSRMNRLLGRGDDAPPLRFNDLIQAL